MDSATPAAPLVAEIRRAVCIEYGIRSRDMLAADRHRSAVRPRQVAMYLARTMTRQSLPAIGKLMGGRDHTTVLHGVRQIARLRADDPELDQIVRRASARSARLGANRAERYSAGCASPPDVDFEVQLEMFA